jgi:hypothetical protein
MTRMPAIPCLTACLAALFAGSLFPQQPETRLNPTVKQIVDAVSQERIAATLKKLEGFGTRYILSSQDDPAHGIGAAKRWIHDELQSYSPRLQVSYQDFSIKKGGRRGQVIRDVDLSNIVAVLPGGAEKDRYVLISGHYDSLVQIRKPYTGEEQTIAELVRQGVDESEARRYLKILPSEREQGPLDFEATAAQTIAPGVTDDGSGTAAVMELARVMSAYQFDKTIVFVAFAAEEVGLSGSQVYAAQAKKDGMQIEAVLNNDIIGSDVSGNGRSSTNVLRVFSSGPDDSATRELARYTKLIAERYVPSMQVQMVFRGDRFLRGGDHRPFVEYFGTVRDARGSNKRRCAGESGAGARATRTQLELVLRAEQRRPRTLAHAREVGLRCSAPLVPEYRAGPGGLRGCDAIYYVAGLGARDLGRQRDQLHDAGCFD